VTAAEPKVLEVRLRLCELCLGGAGGECHSPGCALWLRRAPDLPLHRELYEIDPPRPPPVLHATTLAFPEVESDAFDNLCGSLGLMAEELTDELAEVTCPDCLRAIAAWGQDQGQAACGLAFDFGALAVTHAVTRADLDGTVRLLGRKVAADLLADAFGGRS